MPPASIDKRTDALVHRCLTVQRPVTALAFDYGANERIPAHSHAKAQLIYAVSGTMTVKTEQGAWVLLPTRAVWVPANVRHAIRTRSKLRMRSLYLDHTVPSPSSTCAVLEVSSLLRELILGMLKEPMDYSPNTRAAHLAALIEDELRVPRTLPLHLPWPRDPRLRRVCESMQRAPSLRTSMETAAAAVSISSRTLARLFRAELNMTFHQWRLQLLLLEAQVRLAQGQRSARIAHALGYESHAAFSAMFRRQLGVPPSEHRIASN